MGALVQRRCNLGRFAVLSDMPNLGSVTQVNGGTGQDPRGLEFGRTLCIRTGVRRHVGFDTSSKSHQKRPVTIQ